jgi:hypothetical protein
MFDRFYARQEAVKWPEIDKKNAPNPREAKSKMACARRCSVCVDLLPGVDIDGLDQVGRLLLPIKPFRGSPN